MYFCYVWMNEALATSTVNKAISLDTINIISQVAFDSDDGAAAVLMESRFGQIDPAAVDKVVLDIDGWQTLAKCPFLLHL